jgi:hypothetical protein
MLPQLCISCLTDLIGALKEIGQVEAVLWLANQI